MLQMMPGFRQDDIRFIRTLAPSRPRLRDLDYRGIGMGSMKIVGPTLLLIVAMMPCAAQTRQVRPLPPDPLTQIPRLATHVTNIDLFN